jgi:hypothetical protein
MKRGLRNKLAVLALCALAVLVLSSCLPGGSAVAAKRSKRRRDDDGED